MKGNFSLNYHIQYRRIPILFLISITLVSSSLYLLPLAYSQELSYILRPRIPGAERISGPGSIALHQEGNIYLADTGNNRILVLSSNGTFISGLGNYGAANGMLKSPAGIAVDQEGNVYVADTGNNRIQVFSSNGTFIDKWGKYGGGNGSFNIPQGIAVDQEGSVHIADTGNNRIQVFSSNGTFIEKWGKYALDNTGLRSPEGIAIDSSGNLYVADTNNNRILVLSLSPISNTTFNSEEGEIYGNNTGVELEPIYDGLRIPTSIAFVGPDDMVVLQKENKKIMRIINGQMLDEPILDLGNTVNKITCMCDVAIVHNDNGTAYAFLYYYLAEVPKDDGTTKVVNRLYRYDVIDGKFTHPKLIFEIPSVPNSLHNGGKLMVGPDNNIYLSIGEIKGYQTKAQNNKYGTMPDGSGGILRFTPNGDPVDGGLLGDTHPLDKYYAYGIRNSFGLDYDPITGNIWMTDNGPTYGDELNLLRPGFNGGWNKIMGVSSLKETFDLADLEFFNGTGKYYDPVFEWFQPTGVTDLIFVSSDKLGKVYEGNLLVGDINSGYLYRFLLNKNRTGLLLNGSISDGVANNNTEILGVAFARINGGITDLEIGPDGLVYIASRDGKIVRLQPIDTSTTRTGNATGKTGATDSKLLTPRSVFP